MPGQAMVEGIFKIGVAATWRSHGCRFLLPQEGKDGLKDGEYGIAESIGARIPAVVGERLATPLYLLARSVWDIGAI